ncbi:hypothetical protein ACQBAU_05195 [Propionibacteriaceae bacterium Y2011]|uniref:hypothetical protein n=1 Tax=Microlunatus sp. Y2014 TaxID=3418488 RepID=UPI003B4BBDEB
MPKRSAAVLAWQDSRRPACRRRGMQFVSEAGFVVDDTYITILETRIVQPGNDSGPLQISWSIFIKPLAVDDVLRSAFMPEAEMGPRMRLNRRVNGAFQVWPLRIGRGTSDAAASDDPDWDRVLDQFDRVRAEFIEQHPTVADFAALLEPDGPDQVTGHDLVRLITALLAAERTADAARVVEEAIDRGERGPLHGKADVLQYLRAYADGPESHAAFRASLLPTHDLAVLYESRRSTSIELRRGAVHDRFAEPLFSMDGTDPWAVVLTARRPAGEPDDHSTSLYLQAAGTTDTMVVEFCRPGGDEFGAVSVRSVIGRAPVAGDAPEVEIQVAGRPMVIRANEAMTATEARGLFETFFATDTIGAGHVLRPVEGYTATGTSIDLRDPLSK